MPSLEAGSRLDNITTSINVYVQQEIATGLGLTVYYQGQDRVGNLPQRWVEADLIPASALGEVMTGSGTLTTLVQCMLNLNCYERFGTGNTNLYTLINMVEDIRSKFLVSTAIPVYDYDTAGKPWAASLMVWDRSDVNEVPVAFDTGVKQINISVPLRYYEIIATD